MADGPALRRSTSAPAGRVVRFESDAELVVQPPVVRPASRRRADHVRSRRHAEIPNGFRYYERNRTAPTVEDLNITRGKDTKK